MRFQVSTEHDLRREHIQTLLPSFLSQLGVEQEPLRLSAGETLVEIGNRHAGRRLEPLPEFSRLTRLLAFPPVEMDRQADNEQSDLLLVNKLAKATGVLAAAAACVVFVRTGNRPIRIADGDTDPEVWAFWDIGFEDYAPSGATIPINDLSLFISSNGNATNRGLYEYLDWISGALSYRLIFIWRS